FLKKEFSAENVTFWKACERFQQIPASDTQQLAQEARNIYQEFLSSQALSPVNIDRQAWLGEEVLAEPRPDMFRAQQLQIFNLMKFDSYARFVKSPLYRECLLAEAEGRPLREPSSSRLGSPDATRKKALVLDQDCTVLADQEVRLENRITFELELAALERVVRISAKPTKRLQEALQPILAKHGLSSQQVALRRPGEKQPLDLRKLVSSVAAERLVLDTLP
ncbi:hypothetical protein E2I00_008623, partial [Balaenoptera physalus]